MAKVVGGLLRSMATLFYLLDFLCAAAIIALYSYFIAKLDYHDLNISNQVKAIEGLSGAAVIYSAFAVLLTCFLGGVKFLAFLAILLDLLFMGAMIAIAILVRGAAHSCTGNVTTPLGTGNVNTDGAAGTNLGTACKMNLAVLIIACIAALSFLISALLQFLVSAHHQKEKKYGPSPANDYTSGSGKRKFYQRKVKTETYPMNNDAELGTVVAPATLPVIERVDMRPSHDTAYTGTTMGQETVTKYEAPTVPFVQEPVSTGPNIVSSTTTTSDAYYDPYARPTTTGPNGFVAPSTDYRSTNY